MRAPRVIALHSQMRIGRYSPTRVVPLNAYTQHARNPFKTVPHTLRRFNRFPKL